MDLHAPPPDHFRTLGIDASADARVISRAWRTRVRETHPDLATDAADAARRTRAIAEINVAYEVLSEPARRARWELDRRDWFVAAAAAAADAADAAAEQAAARPGSQSHTFEPEPEAPPEPEAEPSRWAMAVVLTAYGIVDAVRAIWHFFLDDHIGRWVALALVLLVSLSLSALEQAPADLADKTLIAVGALLVLQLLGKTDRSTAPAMLLWHFTLRSGTALLRVFVS